MEIDAQLKAIPNNPGVYLFKDKNYKILYIGKAKNLKKRVISYFRDISTLNLKTALFVKSIYKIDFIITKNELEALILENNLVKKHQPYFNILLKDGKTYPFLKLSVKDDFPALKPVRKIKNDGSKYFGPYLNLKNIYFIIKKIGNEIFGIRRCSKQFRNKKGCLNSQLGLCSGPCIGKITKEDYKLKVDKFINFMKTRGSNLKKELQKKMIEAASELKFEKANIYKEQILAIDSIFLKQRIVIPSNTEDIDVICIQQERSFILIQVLFLRGGYLVSQDYFWFDDREEEKNEILVAFIREFYKNSIIPDKILLNLNLASKEVYEKSFEKKVKIIYPIRGHLKGLINFAEDNGKKLIENKVSKFKRTNSILLAIKDLFKMDSIPESISAFDISNISGTDSVGAMVYWQNGDFIKKNYRKFKIKNFTDYKPDDFAMMNEVVERFLKRYKDTDIIPDIMLIDGGKGQVSKAMEAINQFGFNNKIFVVGLAKKEETFVLSDIKNEIQLKSDSHVRLLFQRIRDEVHRFAITYHRNLRSKRSLKSRLDGIPGVGEKRKKALLEKFKNIAGIINAKPEDIAEIPGISLKKANQIKQILNLK